MPQKTSSDDPSATLVESHLQQTEGLVIKGARANNLKNIDLDIPYDQLVVVTGVSGSGKSSITMDTLFAEGQRRYVESLSSYARQFLGRMKKPDVDMIAGIAPAIAIEQKVTTSNARSTVGTLTEIYEYLRMLYARIGKTISPESGQLVRRHSVADVVDAIHRYEEGTKVQLLIPLVLRYERSVEDELALLLQKGYTRIIIDEALEDIQDIIDNASLPFADNVFVLIDRFVIKKEDEDNRKRIADSIQTAFYESEGEAVLDIIGQEQLSFNNRFELDGITFEDPTPQLFNFNNPYGACAKCEGYGKVVGIDENKVIPDKSKSIAEGAIVAWRGEKANNWLQEVLLNAEAEKLPIHKPYAQLTKAQRKILWDGSKSFSGINAYFAALQAKLYKIQNRVMLARYRGRTTCDMCDGGRLRKEAMYVFIQEKTIADLVDIPISELIEFFDSLDLSEHDSAIAERLLLEIKSRLDTMQQVGLTYLTLNRVSSTLSGGETQRINLTRMLGSNLTSSLYILDEPSIGLHPRDTERLIAVLKGLRDLGNTVIVVEHEEDVIRQADYLVDMGPAAGLHGGEVIFAGPSDEIQAKAPDSLTAQYLDERLKIDVPKTRRKVVNSITIKQAAQHNLKSIDVNIPLGQLVVVTGVSGSGKSTLVKDIFHPALLRHLGESTRQTPGTHASMTGDLKIVSRVEMINQKPIGRSSRSNPVTYVKAYDGIRKLYAEQQLSKIKGFATKHFSFNVEGGRCDACKGEGEIVVEMQFLADVRLTCEECEGQRFKREVLDVRYKDKNISQVLGLSIDEALDFFEGHRDIIDKLQPLQDVGLGYVTLGQSATTLSGGEAQRVKLASFLGQGLTKGHIVFIFDEPTTGLHFHDIRKLLTSLNALIERGHSVIVVEHNLDVIKCADTIIDLGPEGGDEGGYLVFQGTPEALVKHNKGFTAQYLKEKL